MKKTLTIGILAIAAISQAQFATSSTSASHIVFDGNAINSDLETTFDDSSFSIFNAQGRGYASTIEFNDGEIFASTYHILDLAVGAMPVRFRFEQFSYDGKLVLSGGVPLSGGSAEVFSNISLALYEDNNGNGIFDNFGEIADVLVQDSRRLATQVGPGVSFFNGSFLGAGNDLYLIPESNYVVLFGLDYVGNANGNISTNAVTVEYHEPVFSGLQVDFSAEAVPEPATMTVLGLAALVAWRRKK